MSWPDAAPAAHRLVGRRSAIRRALLLGAAGLGAAGLGACGFRPLYATGGAAGAASGTPVAELAAIEVGLIPERPGQQLRTNLELLLDPRGTGGVARYGLKVQLRIDSADVAIRRDETATRRDLTIAARYALTDLADGRLLTHGRAMTVNAYNVVASDVATRAGEQDALEAALKRLAEDIRTQLAIWFERRLQAAS